jgi:signal transduction histidine kinase
MVKDDEGKLLGPAAVLRDVTARWKKEKELKERLAALEGGSSKRAASSG